MVYTPPLYDNILDVVGNTPVARLARLTPEGSNAQIFGKLEFANPGGSVKDRIAVEMVRDAEQQGLISPGETTIVEATSGNTGIGLAVVAAALGYSLTITLPQGMSREREALLHHFGARVEVIESLGGMNEAVQAAKDRAAEGSCWMPDQFNNPANPRAHLKTTGPELLHQLENKIDVLVAGMGTGGTVSGTGQALKEANPKTKVIGVEPASSAVVSGGQPGPHRIQGIGPGFVPNTLNRQIVDEVITVSDQCAIDSALMVASRCGLSVGLSSGAAIWAARAVAQRPEFKSARIAVILPDSGERYISLPFFNTRYS